MIESRWSGVDRALSRVDGALSRVDGALWVRRGRRIAIAALVALLVVSAGIVAIRLWKQRQEQGLAQTAAKLDGVSVSTPTATAVPPTPAPTLTPMPTVLPTPTPFVHVAASMGAVPEAPGPVVVPITLTVTRSDGAALGGELSARLDGDGYFQLGAGEWYTDGAGTAWEVAAQAAVDSFQGSGVLTWTVTLGNGVLALPSFTRTLPSCTRTLPLLWQSGRGVLKVDDVAPAESRPPD